MIKRSATEQKWREESEAAKIKAAKLPPGRLKNQLLREARQLETAWQVAIILGFTTAHIAD
jgi:hypothetical protein